MRSIPATAVIAWTVLSACTTAKLTGSSTPAPEKAPVVTNDVGSKKPTESQSTPVAQSNGDAVSGVVPTSSNTPASSVPGTPNVPPAVGTQSTPSAPSTPTVANSDPIPSVPVAPNIPPTGVVPTTQEPPTAAVPTVPATPPTGVIPSVPATPPTGVIPNDGLLFPAACIANIEEGHHVTDFGYVAKLLDSSGKVIAAAPMSIDAVTRGYACSSAGNSACYVLNIKLSFEATAVADGDATGKLSLCYAKDASAKPEDAICQSLGDSIIPAEPNRRWQYIDLDVGYTVKDRKIQVTKYAGMPGDPNGENVLLMYHPAFAFAAPGACGIDLSSPLVLDLSGDGKINLTSPYAKDAPSFDWRGDGRRSVTGWVGTGVGFLVLGDATADLDGHDLFGEYSRLLDNDGRAKAANRSGKTFANGFDALAQLDANADGKIDALDPAFRRLKVWIDKNGNGKAEPNELHDLASLGIVEINLTRKTVVGAAQHDASGNQIWFTGSYKTKDGATHLMADVWFKARNNPEVAAQGVRP